MPLDLIKIDQAIQSARTESQKAYQQALRDYQIRSQIHALFDDPQYPMRRRSLGRIKTRLGIFNGKEDELRDILFSMTARVVRGDGDDQLWHLPEDAPRPAMPKRPRGPLRLILLATLAVLLVVLGLWKQITGETPAETFKRLTDSGPTYEECLENANGIMTEIMKCHSDFGQLP